MRFNRNVSVAKGMLDMAPLIDVVLQLLIFFMLTSSFVFNPGLKVDLPEYSSSESLNKSDVILTITEEGLYLYNEDVTFLRELANRFRQAAAENPNTRLIIKAASEVPHGDVVRVMVMAREAGIKNQAFATRPEQK